MHHIDPRLPQIVDCLYRLAVKAVIINDHKLLLVKELDDDWWSLPGGGIDYGETVIEALKRELHEEIGVLPSDMQTDGKVVITTVGAIVEGIPKANLFYVVTVPPAKVTIGTDVEKFNWFSASDLNTMHLSPSTGDSIDQLQALL